MKSIVHWLLALSGISLIIFYAYCGAEFLKHSVYAGDFSNFYDAAQAIVLGNNIFSSGHGGYIYPPLVAFIITPLTYFPMKTGAFIWFLINILLLTATLIIGFHTIAKVLQLFSATMLLFPRSGVKSWQVLLGILIFQAGKLIDDLIIHPLGWQWSYFGGTCWCLLFALPFIISAGLAYCETLTADESSTLGEPEIENSPVDCFPGEPPGHGRPGWSRRHGRLHAVIVQKLLIACARLPHMVGDVGE